jgi:hypothetical protein
MRKDLSNTEGGPSQERITELSSGDDEDTDNKSSSMLDATTPDPLDDVLHCLHSIPSSDLPPATPSFPEFDLDSLVSKYRSFQH